MRRIMCDERTRGVYECRSAGRCVEIRPAAIVVIEVVPNMTRARFLSPCARDLETNQRHHMPASSLIRSCDETQKIAEPGG